MVITRAKMLFIAATAVLSACSSSSDTMTPEEAMANIPEELRMFDGFKDAMNKANKTGVMMEERNKQRDELLKQL